MVHQQHREQPWTDHISLNWFRNGNIYVMNQNYLRSNDKVLKRCSKDIHALLDRDSKECSINQGSICGYFTFSGNSMQCLHCWIVYVAYVFNLYADLELLLLIINF
eukprot:639898_1